MATCLALDQHLNGAHMEMFGFADDSCKLLVGVEPVLKATFLWPCPCSWFDCASGFSYIDWSKNVIFTHETFIGGFSGLVMLDGEIERYFVGDRCNQLFKLLFR